MEDAESPVITEADIAGLNQRALLRSTRWARQGAEVALAIALLIALAWLWQLVRYQQLLTDNAAGGGAFGVDVGQVGFTDIPWAQRVDAFASSLYGLSYAAIVAGLGLALRLYGEVATLRAGANVTPWELGDPISDPDDEDYAPPPS